MRGVASRPAYEWYEISSVGTKVTYSQNGGVVVVNLRGRFVIEYDSAYYYNPRTVQDKFEVLIYDTTPAGPTGDNPIVVQYMTANGHTSSTVGLQDQARSVGIQHLFNGRYHRAASQIAPGRAIRYATDSLQTGVGEWGTGRGVGREVLSAGPSPIAGQGRLSFSLPQAGRVQLTVHDIAGRLVRTLVEAELEAGPHAIVWNTRDDAGKQVPGGVYLVRLAAEFGVLARKLVLTR